MIVRALVLLASAAAAGAINFGTYGTLSKKRGWSPWKAGAVTGIVTGVSAVAIAMLSNALGGSGLGMPTAQPVGMLTASPVSGLQVHQLPAGIGLLTAQQLNGVYTQWV